MNGRSHYRLIAAILAAAGALPAAGCWTSAKAGDEMRKAGLERDRRIAELEDKSQADRNELGAKLAQLEEVLQKATDVLTRSSADRGAQVDQMQERLAALEGQLAELRHGFDKTFQDASSRLTELGKRVELLARKVGLDMPVPVAEIPQDKNAHFASGQTAYGAADYSKARALFREYVNRYPEDDRTDNAYYWIGSSYLLEGKPATALGEFRKVITNYSTGDAADMAWFNMAEAFYQLHACTDAKTALETLLRRKLSKEMLRSAKERLNQIKQAPANYCTS